MNRWINPSDGLPKVNHDVLLCLLSGAISTGYLSKRRPEKIWVIHNQEEKDSTVWLWMPLPNSPYVPKVLPAPIREWLDNKFLNNLQI